MPSDSFSNFLQSTSAQITLKLVLITFLVLFLLIPKFMILDLISERENMSAKVTDEVAVGWGNQQVITGPVLILPYNVVTVTNAQVNVSNVTKKYLVIFPDSLNINGQLETHEKYRNIYKVLLYNSSLTISGKFNLPPDGFSGIAKTDLLWNEATLIQGISDIKGLKSKVTM
ncbi:MAG: inner membrane CreD family protein, partial [Saprospiraceae bacterium]|nr:inner membrane CreD family protein [Saprospiraceae bacterium]